VVEQISVLRAKGWRSPVNALMLMSVANYLSFATWNALHTNFAIDAIHFDGTDMGILHTVREIPGFLSFAAVLLLVVMREQTLGLMSLLVIGAGVAATGLFPSALGFYTTTLIKSLGFHYYETVAQSLSLQWFDKQNAPRLLGRVVSASASATIAAYGIIFVVWRWLGLGYVWLFAAGGLTSLLLTGLIGILFPRFQEEVPQRKEIVIRSRYWLYYALVFMGGARRQIFIVFAAFLMVQKFHYDVAGITLLLLINAVINMALGPVIGAMIGRLGDRRSMIVEHAGLIAVFLAYALVENPWVAAGLYVLDNAFFTMSIATKTYFQKIADPGDIAPTSGVAFSINHIAAVLLPIPLGMVWDVDRSAVFVIGAAMAGVALGLSLLVPHAPHAGNESVFAQRLAATAE
jgi:Major Facilitator Superfamily